MFVSLYLVGLLFLVLGVCIYLTSIKYRNYPGLPPIPVIGDLYDSFSTYSTSLDKVMKDVAEGFDKFGETYAKRFGPAVVICTGDPVLIEALSYHPLMADKEPLIYNSLAAIFHGPFSKAHSDKKWKDLRKTFVNGMNRRHIEAYHGVFVRRAQELVDVLANQAEEFDVHPFVMLNSLDIVAESLTGFSFDFLKEKKFQYYQDFKTINDEIIERMLSFGWKPLNNRYITSTLRNIWPVLTKVLNEIKNKTHIFQLELGYIPLVGEIVREQVKRGATEPQLMRHITEAFMEAFYTNGIVIASALLHLAVFPEFQEQAWAEQKEIMGDTKGFVTMDDLKRMIYLDRVFKETVRVMGPPIFTRRSRGDIRVGNHFIPNNSTVVYSFDRMRKDPKYWKTPLKFNPDHFLPGEVAKRPKITFIGFGVGVRTCAGYQYALNSSKVVLSTVLRHFKLTSPLKAEDLKMSGSIFMSLKVPHTVSLELR